MEAFPGLEDGETLGRVTTLSGLMEHLGTTVTGHQDSQVMTGVMKKELVEMEESLQTAVAAAVSQAVRAAVQRGPRDDDDHNQ